MRPGANTSSMCCGAVGDLPMSALANIPLFRVYTPDTAQAGLAAVLSSGQLATGPQVTTFEAALARWFDVTSAVALSDASAGLTLALYMAGVRPGDEVITTPLACAASLMPIANLFARPVWCDIDPTTASLDVAALAACITPRTKAILLYHWSGYVGDIAPILALARQLDICVIQDASEAFGAEYGGQRMACLADYAVYSFYATKHLTTGEGAVLLAADERNVQRARQLRRFGIDAANLRLANGDLNPDFDIPLAGFNVPMNEIAATLGIAALAQVDGLLQRYVSNGIYFDQALQNIPGLQPLSYSPHSMPAWWTYVIAVERRDDLIRKLHQHGIGAQRLHVRMDGYTCFGGQRQDLPGVAQFDATNLSIPCGWWVGDAERERIAACIRSGW